MKKLPESEKIFYPQLYGDMGFSEKLERVFGSEYRLRWSVREGAWHLEQFLGQRALRWNKNRPLDPWYDELVRARDGYTLAMSIRPGQRMPCPKCGATLAVPLREVREVRCTPCIRAGFDGKYKAAFFPLDELFLDYIKARTPSYSGTFVADEQQKLAEKANAYKDYQQERIIDHGRDALKDAFLDQFPKAGFPSLTLDAWRH